MADWKQALDYNMANMTNLAKGNGGIMKAYGELTKAAASKGALDDKTRELIALAVAATTRCDGCIAVHTAEAVKAGATREELLETLAMAIALNTGAAAIYSSRILEAYDQFAAK